MTHPFVLVSDMNVAFNNPKGDPYLFDKMPFAPGEVVPADAEAKFPGLSNLLEHADKAWAKLERQCKNILAEYNELMRAIAARDVDAVRDALCDIHVFAYGGHHFMGYQASTDLESVVEALYSRFCHDEHTLEATKAHFDSMGVEYYVEGTFPTVCLKSAKDQMMPEYPKGKFLKCVDYHTPGFYALDPISLYDLIAKYALPVGLAAAPAPESKLDITNVMAKEREALQAEWKRKQELINKQVEEYRGKLEQEAFGLKPYDSKAGI